MLPNIIRCTAPFPAASLREQCVSCKVSAGRHEEALDVLGEASRARFGKQGSHPRSNHVGMHIHYMFALTRTCFCSRVLDTPPF